MKRNHIWWLVPIGALIGLMASFVWPWPDSDIACPSAGLNACVAKANLLAQHLQWSIVGALFGFIVALLFVTARYVTRSRGESRDLIGN